MLMDGSLSAKNWLKTSDGLSKVKVKVKFTIEQATKTQKGSRGIALLFL
jgi:hypothetical protein